MSVKVNKADGVTVVTLTSDPHSPCPPLCQILSVLCYNPSCYTVSPHMRKVQTGSLLVLGTLQIMIGLLNIGLGAPARSSWDMYYTGFPYWLGAVFILFGVLCVVSVKYPSPCLVTLTVVLNITGVAFSIVAVVLYSLNLAYIYNFGLCGDHWDSWTTESVSCQMLLYGLNSLLVMASVMELCVVISASVLGVRTLRSKEKTTQHEVQKKPEKISEVLSLPDAVTTESQSTKTPNPDQEGESAWCCNNNPLLEKGGTTPAA